MYRAEYPLPCSARDIELGRRIWGLSTPPVDVAHSVIVAARPRGGSVRERGQGSRSAALVDHLAERDPGRHGDRRARASRAGGSGLPALQVAGVDLVDLALAWPAAAQRRGRARTSSLTGCAVLRHRGEHHPRCRRSASHARATSACAAWNGRSVGRPGGGGSSARAVKKPATAASTASTSASAIGG